MKRIALALACSVLFLLFLWKAREPRSESSPPQSEPDSVNARAAAVEASVRADTAVTERQPITEDPQIQGRVISNSVGPLSGARVRLVEAADRAPEPEGIEVLSGDDGSFAFDRLPSPRLGAVLVVQAEGHARGGLDLTENEASGEVEILLEAADAVEVRVVGADGRPVEGARVVHEVAGEGLAATPLQWIRLLTTRAITDAGGLVRLTAFPTCVNDQVIRAEKGDLVSIPWRGERPSIVRLQLGRSFTLDGTLAASDPASDDVTGLRISVLGQTGNLWRRLATLEDAGIGSWGPLVVPLDGVAGYRVRAEGGPMLPVEETFGPPAANARHRVDLLLTRGSGLELVVRDEAGELVGTASCLAWWSPSVQPDGVHVSRGTQVGQGHFQIAGLPPGWVQYRVEAPGFALFEYWAEMPLAQPVEVTLTRGGMVVGRCLHDGKPVSDFEVIYWKEGNPRTDRRRSFFGREDGRFEIDHLSEGGWFLYAASPEYPSGSPTGVRTRPDEVVEVEIELPEALGGGGRVLSAESGEPIAGARVQAFSSGGTEMSFPWGPPVESSQDGTFELNAFVAGSNYIRVDADGFASSFAQASAEQEGFVEWGDIRLHRPQRLRLSLLGLDEIHGLEPTELRAGTTRGHVLPQTPFDADGIVEFDEVPPGAHELVIFYPDNSWARLQLQLDPGEQWDHDLKIGGERTLELRVLDARGEQLPFTPQVMLVAQEETGVLVVRLRVTYEDGTIQFAGIRADRVQAWIYDWDQRTIGSREIDLVANAGRRVEIRLDGKAFRARIVDRDGAPVAGASVSMRSETGDEILGAQATDTDGWASFFGLPASTVLMDVGHGRLGRRFGVPIDASEDEIEFVLEADGALEVELRDGDVPLAGVAVEIQTESGVRLSERKQTAADGRLSFEPLGEGRYNLACSRSDCWPVTVTRELAASERAAMTVEMRRLADLVLAVTNAAGLPVSGLAVELAPVDLEGDVVRWIEEGRVRAPGGLETDVRGELRIERLPRGSYTWSIPTPDGALSGAFELQAASENAVRVVVPD